MAASAGRRTFGLALLAEVRSIRRGLAGYRRRLDLMLADGAVSLQEAQHFRAVLPFWRHDTSVFALSSARVGLFMPALAVSLLEFYSRVRWLDTRAANAPHGEEADALLAPWLHEHRRSIAYTHLRGAQILRALRQETSTTLSDVLRGARRARLRRARSLLARRGEPG